MIYHAWLLHQRLVLEGSKARERQMDQDTFRLRQEMRQKSKAKQILSCTWPDKPPSYGRT